jgi:hypothetical protein
MGQLIHFDFAAARREREPVTEPFTPQIIKVDFKRLREVLLKRYHREILLIQRLALSPDELEVRLLNLMARAKRDGVDLNNLTGG